MRNKLLIRGSLIRAAYGIAALAFPEILFKALGIKETDPDARYLNRLFGGRDLLVAGQTVAKVRGGGGGSATAINLIAEATDTASLVQEYKARGKFDRVLFVGLAFNIVGYATWLRALVSRPATTKEIASQLQSDAADAVAGKADEVGKKADQAGKKAVKVRRRAAKKASKRASEIESKASKRASEIESKAAKRAAEIEAKASQQARKLQKQASEAAAAAAGKASSVAADSETAQNVVKLSRRAAKKARAAADAVQAA